MSSDSFQSNKTEMSGASSRRMALYDEGNPDQASEPEILERFRDGIRPETRVIGTTWVHSNNGFRMPIPAMSAIVAEANRNRDEDERIAFVVDGVHGFGIEDMGVQELGCEFFCAGTHKWIFGPRGGGVVWGRPEVQDRVSPIIPSFTRGGWGGTMSPRIAISAARERSLLGRITDALCFRAESSLGVSWTEAAELAAPGPLTRQLTVDLSGLDGGDYLLGVQVERADRYGNELFARH